MTARKLANNQDFNGRKGTNLGAPSAPNDTARNVDVTTAYTNAISRTNHTGSQLASTISDFNSAVRTNRLDQMAAPTAPVGFGGQQLTGLADPSSAQHAATMAYVDSAVAGLAGGMQFKGTVRVVHTANVNIANPGTSTFDGLTISNGQIVLLTGQSTGSQNGPYTFNGSGSSMTRAANWDSTGEAKVGSFWVVTEGTRADSFAIMTNDTFTLATDAASFQYISVAPSALAPVEQDMGDNSATQFTVTHNFGTKAVLVQVFRNASPYDEIDVYVARPTINTVSIEPDDVWTSGEMHAVVSKA